MGTRGFRIIKFKGRYWIFYNQYDSYPEGLGNSLVESIPEDPEQYQKWLQSQRDFYTKWDSLLEELLTIRPEDLRRLHSDELDMPVFHAAFDERLHEDAPPCYRSGFNDLFVEWTYTIDLDREVFSVDNGAHFRLNHIPRNNHWIEALFIDNKRARYLLPQLIPAQCVATLAINPPDIRVSTKYETLQTRRVKPKGLDHIPPSHRTGPRLRWILFNFFQSLQQTDLSINLLGWQAQDLPFREFTFFILCLAAGGEHLALVDQRRVKEPYHECLYMGMMTEDNSEGDTELSTCLGVGFHMNGLPMGSAPQDTKYWYEGALVCLVPQLDYPGILKNAIADAIEYGRAKCNRNSFNAVLISIEHLVLIKSFPDGSLDHTGLLPLIPIPIHYSKDSRARYGDRLLEDFYNKEFSVKKPKVEEPSETDIEQLNQHSDRHDSKSDHNVDDGKGAIKGELERDGKIEEGTDDSGVVVNVEDEDVVDSENSDVEDTGISIKNSFMALVQFFEATTLETLRPTQPNEARLPEEICEMVLRNVSDTKTYNSCLKVSRRFRLICQQRPLLMDDITFLEPLPNDPASLTNKEKEDGIHGSQLLPDFLAVDVSSDRQMGVWLRSGNGLGDSLTCFVVGGNERHRKSFADLRINFQGLCVPLPEPDEAGKRKIRAAPRQYEKEPTSYGSESTPWEYAITVDDLNMESSTRRLGRFWNLAARDLKHSVEATTEPAWTLPPNTLYYLGTHETYGEKGGASYWRSFHYIYLRVKGASKYWDNQWSDIVREATEDMNCADERKRKYWSRDSPKDEVGGADNPYVILMVGLQVRLFKWEQGFDESVDEGARRKFSPSSTLREINPGKVLDMRERSDREEIEKFLNKAEELKEFIKARESKKCGGEET